MKLNGKPVVDGRKGFDFEVLKGDVAKAKTKNPGECAAAKAILRENPDIKSVRVHLSRIYIERAKNWERYETPNAVKTEIVSFDRGGGFQVDTYRALPMRQSQSSEAARERWQKRKLTHVDNRKNHESKKIRHSALDVRERADVGSRRS
jgi:hypothetical protein